MEGFKNVIEAVKATPSVKKLIYTSSFFAVGPTDGYIGDETQVWIPILLTLSLLKTPLTSL